MTTFEERGDGFEKKFAHDAELKFKAEARRNKMLGEWAAELLGHEDPAAYVKEVIASDFAEAGDDDVFAKLRADLDAKGVSISDADIRSKMNELLAKAVEQVQA